MAELTNTTEPSANSSCCAPEVQASCCEPSAKAECCDSSHGDGCGCAAGDTAPESGDIREPVRERHVAAAEQAASAIIRARRPTTTSA